MKERTLSKFLFLRCFFGKGEENTTVDDGTVLAFFRYLFMSYRSTGLDSGKH